MTSDERLALIWRKINRANQHLGDLKRTVADFLGQNPYKISAKHDPVKQQVTYYVAHIEPPPEALATITGDVLHNLRCALDHLAQQLYLAGSPGRVGFRDMTSFPIAKSAKAFKKDIGGKIEGMRKDAIDAIRAMEPYKGGKGDALWTLHRLNNIDKHRLLVAVVARFQGVDLGPAMARDMSKILGKSVPQMEAFFSVTPKSGFRPMEVGDELLTEAGDAKPHKDFKFKILVALYEPGVVEGEPLVETVEGLANLVSHIVTDFRPCLA